jgi:hypothetical protein
LKFGFDGVKPWPCLTRTSGVPSSRGLASFATKIQLAVPPVSLVRDVASKRVPSKDFRTSTSIESSKDMMAMKLEKIVGRRRGANLGRSGAWTVKYNVHGWGQILALCSTCSLRRESFGERNWLDVGRSALLQVRELS